MESSKPELLLSSTRPVGQEHFIRKHGYKYRLWMSATNWHYKIMTFFGQEDLMTSQTLGLCAEQIGSSEMTVKQKQDDILNHIQKSVITSSPHSKRCFSINSVKTKGDICTLSLAHSLSLHWKSKFLTAPLFKFSTSWE